MASGLFTGHLFVVASAFAVATAATVELHDKTASRRLQSSCDSFGAPLVDTELSGGTEGLDVTSTGTPVDNCCQTCFDDSACTGFVIFGAACYLKSGSLSTFTLSDRTSYLRLITPTSPPLPPFPGHPPGLAPQPPPTPPPTPCSAFNGPNADTELAGGDGGLQTTSTSASPSTASPDSCCTACTDDPACTGFVIFSGSAFQHCSCSRTSPSRALPPTPPSCTLNPVLHSSLAFCERSDHPSLPSSAQLATSRAASSPRQAQRTASATTFRLRHRCHRRHRRLHLRLHLHPRSRPLLVLRQRRRWRPLPRAARASLRRLGSTLSSAVVTSAPQLTRPSTIAALLVRHCRIASAL